MSIGNLLKAVVKTAKANPALVISLITAAAPVAKAVMSEAKRT